MQTAAAKFSGCAGNFPCFLERRVENAAGPSGSDVLSFISELAPELVLI
jgi:hypothetical protein